MINHKDKEWVYYKDIEGSSAGPGVVRRVLSYCDNLMCVENSFETGAEGPIHTHPHTQISYVVKGRFKYIIGDVAHEVSAGDTMCKQNEVKHGCVCLEKGMILDIFTPMREDFVK